MYRLFSPQVILDNVVSLAYPYVADQSQLTAASLKQAYRDYLNHIQPNCPYRDNPQLFHASPEAELAFANYFSGEDVDTTELDSQVDVNKVMYPHAPDRLNVLENALRSLETIDPTFNELFRLVMNTVLCTASARIGGTSVNPQFIGVMCASHDMMAEVSAAPELLIHEFTHTTLFLDELRYGHYDYEKLYDPSTFIDASARGVQFKFPFHRCFHSLIVTAEVLLARDAYIGHEPKITQHLTSPQLVARSLKYVDAIKNSKPIQQMMTDRCRELFAACEKFYTEYQIP